MRTKNRPQALEESPANVRRIARKRAKNRPHAYEESPIVQVFDLSDDRLSASRQTAVFQPLPFRLQAAVGPSLKSLILLSSLFAQIAQLVEQRTENPRVAGSIPALGTKVWLQALSFHCLEQFFYL